MLCAISTMLVTCICLYKAKEPLRTVQTKRKRRVTVFPTMSNIPDHVIYEQYAAMRKDYQEFKGYNPIDEDNEQDLKRPKVSLKKEQLTK